LIRGVGTKHWQVENTCVTGCARWPRRQSATGRRQETVGHDDRTGGHRHRL